MACIAASICAGSAAAVPCEAGACWRARVPIRGGGMLEAPIHRDPARGPRLQVCLLGADYVAREIEAIEILAGEDVPIAVEKRTPQMRRQRAQSFQVMLVARVDRIVGDARGNEIVIGWIVLGGIFHAGRGLLVNPQRFDPGVADVAGIRRRGHARKRAGHWTTVAAGQELHWRSVKSVSSSMPMKRNSA